MSGLGTRTVWTASLTVVALLSAMAGLIGNLGGARNTICSLPAAKQTCIKSGLVTYLELEKAETVPVSPIQASGALSVQPAANPKDISGTWRGYYFGGGNPRTKFELDIAWRSTGSFRGVIAEEDTIGRGRGIDNDGEERGSSVNGISNENGSVTFTKEYDCTNGVCHKVTYDGVLDEAGRTITGTWRIDDLHGEFKITRE